MSHRNRRTKILLALFIAIGLISLGAGIDSFSVFAQGQETCPDGGDWTKTDLPQGSEKYTHNFNAPEGKLIDRVCYKNGTNVAYIDVEPPAEEYT